MMEFEEFDENAFFEDYNEEEEEAKLPGSSGDGQKDVKDNAKAKILESIWENAKEGKKKARRMAPRPKLTERELVSAKGLPALKEMFDGYQFPSGVTDPYDKLGILLNKMEFWAHNLFPQMTFDDCLEKIEKLGHKRLTKAVMNKLRLGMKIDDEEKENALKKSDEGSAEEKEEEDEEQRRKRIGRKKGAEEEEEAAGEVEEIDPGDLPSTSAPSGSTRAGKHYRQDSEESEDDGLLLDQFLIKEAGGKNAGREETKAERKPSQAKAEEYHLISDSDQQQPAAVTDDDSDVEISAGSAKKKRRIVIEDDEDEW